MVKGKNYKICLLYKLKLCMEGSGLGIFFFLFFRQKYTEQSAVLKPKLFSNVLFLIIVLSIK